MENPISLAFLTTYDVSPLDAVRIAGEAGYDMVGLRLLAAAPSEGKYPIMTDMFLQKAVAKALEATGVQLADIEIARLKAGTNVADFEPFCVLGQRLGARHVLVAGDDPERNRLIQTYGAFCELAGRYGLTADIEPMPWTEVKNLADANQITGAVGYENSGILIDALHWDRSGDTASDISALPANRLHYAQVCDGPRPYDPSDAGMIRIAREARLHPGDGGIDLKAMLRALPTNLPISVEIPNHALARHHAPIERAVMALASTKALMAEI
ncbi:MAG: sugar phosphate isomerase/epimerase [Rhizobiales bacterium]|nr:sugar phosphate isomerase/epimerase [Hyphomicrobiales bacterium]